MSLVIPDKKSKVKTSVDIDYDLLSKAQKKMKQKNHTLRMIVEAALREYIGDSSEQTRRK